MHVLFYSSTVDFYILILNDLDDILHLTRWTLPPPVILLFRRNGKRRAELRHLFNVMTFVMTSE